MTILTKILPLLFVLFSLVGKSFGQTSWSFFHDADFLEFDSKPRVTYNDGLFHLAWQNFQDGITHVTTDGNSGGDSTNTTQFQLRSSFIFHFKNFAISPTDDLLFLGDEFIPSLGISDLPDTRVSLNDFPDRNSAENATATAVAFGNGRYVATFSEDTSFSISEPILALGSSNDLSSWEHNILPFGFSLENVIYKNGLFVTVGRFSDPEDLFAEERGAILTSIDGQQWSIFLTQEATTFHDLTFDGTDWIVVGEDSAIWTSSNGYVWQEAPSPGGSIDLTAVAVGNDYLILGSEDGAIYSSTDRSSFVQQDQFSECVSDIEVGNGMFLAAVGTHYVSSPFSPDGIADIVEHPESQFFIAGDQVTLSVAAIGDGPLSYQWYVGERGDTSNPISGATSPTYQTPPLSSSQNYWVQVSNTIGFEESLTASVTLLTTPIFTQQPLGFITNMGTSDFLRVEASGNDISYQWYEGFSGDTSQPVNRTSTFFFPPDDFPGIFHYWVRASNALGYVDSVTAEVEILPVFPVIILQPQDLTMPVGNFLGNTLYVEATGPNLSYQWYEGSSGDTSSPIEGFSGFSRFFFPSTSTAGEFLYWVRVSNGAGFVDSRTSTFIVTLLSSPNNL